MAITGANVTSEAGKCEPILSAITFPTQSHTRRTKESAANSPFIAWHWSALFAVSLLLYLPFLGIRSNLDGHETLVAQTAREMLDRGDWMLPTFSGVPRYQKPPLAYWLTATTYALTGIISDATARLPFAISAMVLVVFLGYVSTRLFGLTTGLFTGLIQATMAWSILYGKSALVDITLTLFISMAILASAMDRWSRFGHFAPTIFWLTTALAVLAKGPLALPLIFIPILSYRCLRTRHLADVLLLTHPTSLLGFPLFLILSLAWPLAMYAQDPNVIDLWYGQSVERFLEHWGPNTRPWYFYAYQIPLLTLPWSPLWILELTSSLRHRFSSASSRVSALAIDEYSLLWVWFGVGFAFFSLSEGKREHYILPALPPLSILAALALPRWGALFRPWVESHFRIVRRVLLSVTVLCLAAGVLLSSTYHPMALPSAVLAALASAAVLAACSWNRKPAEIRFPVMFFLLGIAVVLVLDGSLAPALNPRTSLLELFQRNEGLIANSEKVVQFGSNDRWAIFLLNRPMAWPRTIQEMRAEIEVSTDTLLLVRRDKLAEIQGVFDLKIIDSTEEGNGRDDFVLGQIENKAKNDKRTQTR